MEPIDVRLIVVHCSATPQSRDIGAKEIDAMHRQRGWSGIGYHFVIRRNGAIEPGRPLNQHGAHTKGHNYHSWGICLIGGGDKREGAEQNYSPEQMASLRMVIKSLKQIAPQAEVLGHRDLSPDVDNDGVIERHEWLKECPCFPVKEWLASAD